MSAASAAVRTRVVATLGPATGSRIAELVAEGVDVFRLNMAHGTPAAHARTIGDIRRVAGERPVGILLDLAGPKLRLDRPLRGAPGDVVALALPPTVRRGDPVLLADGLMQLEVVDVSHARVVVGGAVPAGKGMNLPSSRLDLPALTERDRLGLEFAVAEGVDFVGLSFVGRAADVEPARASGLPVIAKIERAEALEHLEEIVDAADGVMVARGDLGVEIPIERVPLVQKRIIALANAAAKPVITATQMLRSMVESPLPTRAEATDVANAALDGTDAVMLSEETAVGRYPIDAVRMMRRILREVDGHVATRPGEDTPDVAAQVTGAAAVMAGRLAVGAIVVATRSGATARRVARHRPRVPVIALTSDATVRRRLSLVWGVTAVVVPGLAEGAAVLERFREPVRATGLVPDGARLIVTAGWPLGLGGVSNMVYVTAL